MTVGFQVAFLHFVFCRTCCPDVMLERIPLSFFQVDELVICSYKTVLMALMSFKSNYADVNQNRVLLQIQSESVYTCTGYAPAP